MTYVLSYSENDVFQKHKIMVIILKSNVQTGTFFKGVVFRTREIYPD